MFVKLMSVKNIVIAAGFVLIATLPTQSISHHAFGAEFDANRPVQLEGSLTRIEWVNPHSWFHIEVENAEGIKEQWRIEGGTPNTLLRRGIHKRSLAIGTVIIVDGYQAKDLSNKANGRNITLASGESMFMGSSGTGAPDDGADPTGT